MSEGPDALLCAPCLLQDAAQTSLAITVMDGTALCVHCLARRREAWLAMLEQGGTPLTIGRSKK